MNYMPLREQITEVKRELYFRSRVYPGLVGRGKMTQADADKHTERMAAVLLTLEELESKGRLP